MIAGIPTQETFNAQVIARWLEDVDTENTSETVSYVAVDDGTKSWTFSGAPVAQLGLEDLIRVTVNPRTGRLINLDVLEHQRPNTPTLAERVAVRPPRPPDPLLSNDEVTQVVGPVSRTSGDPHHRRIRHVVSRSERQPQPHRRRQRRRELRGEGRAAQRHSAAWHR